jgi:hypothetical protein
MEEVLADGGQLFLQGLVQCRNDFGMSLHMLQFSNMLEK